MAVTFKKKKKDNKKKNGNGNHITKGKIIVL